MVVCEDEVGRLNPLEFGVLVLRFRRMGLNIESRLNPLEFGVLVLRA